MLIVSGPTASGKTALAAALAEAFNSEVINVDSVQVYRELNIGSAKPDTETLARVRHRLIGELNPDQPCDGAWFRAQALAAARELAAQKRLPVLAGGTTMYLSLLMSGIAELPGRDEKLRRELHALDPDLRYRMLQESDPAMAAKLHPNDTTRVVRALEVQQLAHRSQLETFGHSDSKGGMPALVLIPAYSRRELRQRIAQRTAEMLSRGLQAETESIIARYGSGAPSLRSIGYAECVRAIMGDLSASELADRITIATSQLAKRQMTFWRNEPRKRGWDVRPASSREPEVEVLDQSTDERSSRQNRVEPTPVYSLCFSSLCDRLRDRLTHPLERSEVWWLNGRSLWPDRP